MSDRLYKEDARRDPTYSSVVEAMNDLLLDRCWVSKNEILKRARATAWKSQIRWAWVLEFITAPGSLILPLSSQYWLRRQRRSVLPSKYVAPNYTSARGFASVSEFVLLGELERSIALAKFSQTQISAAKAVDISVRLNEVITTAIQHRTPDQIGVSLT